jgi:hypothetical protein
MYWGGAGEGGGEGEGLRGGRARGAGMRHATRAHAGARARAAAGCRATPAPIARCTDGRGGRGAAGRAGARGRGPAAAPRARARARAPPRPAPPRRGGPPPHREDLRGPRGQREALAAAQAQARRSLDLALLLLEHVPEVGRCPRARNAERAVDAPFHASAPLDDAFWRQLLRLLAQAPAHRGGGRGLRHGRGTGSSPRPGAARGAPPSRSKHKVFGR